MCGVYNTGFIKKYVSGIKYTHTHMCVVGCVVVVLLLWCCCWVCCCGVVVGCVVVGCVVVGCVVWCYIIGLGLHLIKQYRALALMSEWQYIALIIV